MFIFRFLFCLAIPINIASAQSQTPLIDINSKCKSDSSATCEGNCMDGWSMRCYYEAKKNNVKPNLHIESQRSQCFAFYEQSVCTPCKNNHLLKANDKLRKVRCEDFYSAINSKNKECSGCLKTIFSAS
jgi:hypothetical protein